MSLAYMVTPAPHTAGAATEPWYAAEVDGDTDVTGTVPLATAVHGPAVSRTSMDLVGSVAVEEQRMGITTRALRNV